MTRETPCDWGNCPYNAMYGEDCRYYCGLGVDDDSYPDEEDILTSIHDYSYPVSQNDTGND